MFGPGERSQERMEDLCGDMNRVLMRCWSLLPVSGGVDMTIIETIRTAERQQELIDDGKSWTMDSDHLRLDDDNSGVLAVDIYPWIPGIGASQAELHYRVIARHMFHAAQLEGVNIYWGGFWNPKDSPHWAKRRVPQWD